MKFPSTWNSFDISHFWVAQHTALLRERSTGWPLNVQPAGGLSLPRCVSAPVYFVQIFLFCFIILCVYTQEPQNLMIWIVVCCGVRVINRSGTPSRRFRNALSFFWFPRFQPQNRLSLAIYSKWYFELRYLLCIPFSISQASFYYHHLLSQTFFNCLK